MVYEQARRPGETELVSAPKQLNSPFGAAGSSQAFNRNDMLGQLAQHLSQNGAITESPFERVQHVPQSDLPKVKVGERGDGANEARLALLAGSQTMSDLLQSSMWVPQAVVEEIAGEYAEFINEYRWSIVGSLLVFTAARGASWLLAKSPTLPSQVAALVINAGLMSVGLIVGAEAVGAAAEHLAAWARLAWNANGDRACLDAASKEFMQTLVTLSVAVIAGESAWRSFAYAGKLSNRPSPGPANAGSQSPSRELPFSGRANPQPQGAASQDLDTFWNAMTERYEFGRMPAFGGGSFSKAERAALARTQAALMQSSNVGELRALARSNGNMVGALPPFVGAAPVAEPPVRIHPPSNKSEYATNNFLEVARFDDLESAVRDILANGSGRLGSAELAREAQTLADMLRVVKNPNGPGDFLVLEAYAKRVERTFQRRRLPKSAKDSGQTYTEAEQWLQNEILSLPTLKYRGGKRIRNDVRDKLLKVHGMIPPDGQLQAATLFNELAYGDRPFSGTALEDVVDINFVIVFINTLAEKIPQLKVKTSLQQLSQDWAPRPARRPIVPGLEPRAFTISGQQFWINLADKDFAVLKLFIKRYNRSPDSPLSLPWDEIKEFYGDREYGVVSQAIERLNRQLKRVTRTRNAPIESEVDLGEIVANNIAKGPGKPRPFQETRPGSQLKTRHAVVNGQGGLYSFKPNPALIPEVKN